MIASASRARVLEALSNIPADAWRADAVREQPPEPFRAIVGTLLAFSTPWLPSPLRLLVAGAAAAVDAQVRGTVLPLRMQHGHFREQRGWMMPLSQAGHPVRVIASSLSDLTCGRLLDRELCISPILRNHRTAS
ncbi:hypothetical protein [Thiocapsa sp.]|uniref:hypothetical protein n=1 Tax=Thiocapsa sp. TaxID=2024551 RepID=UPI001BCE2DCF|nr:hypothetical protein [Thiocapsa sp.]